MALTRRTKWLMTGAAALGAAVGAAGIAGAATGTGSSATNNAATSASAAAVQGQDPASVSHGPGETLLTGTTADKVAAAAKTAVPGGTIIRVETDSDGATYEAHVRKADGTYVTLKFDSAFNVTDTLEGFGGPGAGGRAGGGPGGYGTPSG
jgi:hypothetical protein